MRRIIVLFYVLILGHTTNAQIFAITEDGRKVILYENHTWRYSDDLQDNHKPEKDINRIQVMSDGMARIYLWVNSHRIGFYDGKIIMNTNEPMQIEYHQNSYFEKSVGKIKKITFNDISISFEYCQNPIFKFSLGKIESISFGNERIDFEYYQNDYFEKTEGKVSKISKGSNYVNFEFYQNPIYKETEGRLKAITGNIPGIEISYIE